MKIKVEMDESITEDEVVIRCSSYSEDIAALQKRIMEAVAVRQQLCVYRGDTDYYLSLQEILFLETEGVGVAVHTRTEIYSTHMRLYELAELLPGSFIRVSKSTIINVTKIRAVKKNITGASQVEFTGTEKKAFVSRSFFKEFITKMEEKRLDK